MHNSACVPWEYCSEIRETTVAKNRKFDTARDKSKITKKKDSVKIPSKLIIKWIHDKV